MKIKMWYSIGKYKEHPSEMGQKCGRKAQERGQKEHSKWRDKCERKAWGRVFIQWPSAHLHLLLSYFPGKGTLDTALTDEMWAKDCWAGFLFYWNQTKQKNRSWHSSLILLLSTTIFIAWNMEEKLEIRQPHCEYKVQSQHTKFGVAERQKGPGSLDSVLRSYNSP